MDEKTQQAFLQWLAQKLGVKTQEELQAAIEKLGKEGLQKAFQQFQQEMQQAQKAQKGAKINYLRGLKGLCPEGYKTVTFKQGGRICTKCEKLKKGNAIDEFKKLKRK